jgi:hypothetical protein
VRLAKRSIRARLRIAGNLPSQRIAAGCGTALRVGEWSPVLRHIKSPYFRVPNWCLIFRHFDLRSTVRLSFFAKPLCRGLACRVQALIAPFYCPELRSLGLAQWRGAMGIEPIRAVAASVLWIRLAYAQKLGTDLGFSLLRG